MDDYNDFNSNKITIETTSPLNLLFERIAYFGAAYAYLQHFNPEKALEILKLQRHSSGLYSELLGRCYYELELEKLGLYHLGDIETVNPLYINHLDVLGLILLQLKNKDALKKIIETIPTIHCEHTLYQNFLGISSLLNNELNKAFAHFLKALKSDECSVFAYYGLGLLYTSQGNEQQARLCFLICTHLDPLMYQSYYAFGQLHIGQKDYTSALPMIDQAMKIYPHKLNMWDSLSQCIYNLYQKEDALDVLFMGIHMHPNDNRYKFMSALNALKFGDLKLCLALLFDVFYIEAQFTDEGFFAKLVKNAYSNVLIKPSKASAIIELINSYCAQNADFMLRNAAFEAIVSILDGISRYHQKILNMK